MSTFCNIAWKHFFKSSNNVDFSYCMSCVKFYNILHDCYLIVACHSFNSFILSLFIDVESNIVQQELLTLPDHQTYVFFIMFYCFYRQFCCLQPFSGNVIICTFISTYINCKWFTVVEEMRIVPSVYKDIYLPNYHGGNDRKPVTFYIDISQLFWIYICIKRWCSRLANEKKRINK